MHHISKISTSGKAIQNPVYAGRLPQRFR
ncbi:hypothetical protein IL54_1224 [Sphingobium sp. ba1]|nr:hypothetical protein IL54_1224 [Sphingobium sp. ba1]